MEPPRGGALQGNAAETAVHHHHPAPARLLILDEPFSGFDPINTNLLKEEILQLKKEGTTIILSTHNMASVEEICDEIALINQSRKILEGNLFDVKNRFKKNIFSLEIQEEDPAVEAMLGEQFSVLGKEPLPHSVQYRIQIPEGKRSNDLLSAVMQHTDILSFSEILPTMNEIFIEQVENFNKAHHDEK